MERLLFFAENEHQHIILKDINISQTILKQFINKQAVQSNYKIS
jgi:hypothetical protein